MSRPEPVLRLGDGQLDLASPVLMGVVNATPDSFSDGAAERRGGVEGCVARARALVAAGAGMIDVGGESQITNRPAISDAEEVARVVPVIEALADELDVPISVDTYKPGVARAAVAAGATLVNDVSGLARVELADVCAASGAGLVVMHTRSRPKVKRLEPGLYAGDVAGDVARFVAERVALAIGRGVERERIVVDPGPDFGKTPAQTVAALRGIAALHALGRPVLLALSRKDFVGAITHRGPRERLAGTLAAIGWGVDVGGHLLRVHDVAEVSDFLAVRAVLRGDVALPETTALPEGLRRV